MCSPIAGCRYFPPRDPSAQARICKRRGAIPSPSRRIERALCHVMRACVGAWRPGESRQIGSVEGTCSTNSSNSRNHQLNAEWRSGAAGIISRNDETASVSKAKYPRATCQPATYLGELVHRVRRESLHKARYSAEPLSLIAFFYSRQA